ncbi:NIPSNAP family protein [Rhodopseudomonas sp. P2A-2r]|uniref:NIPSNAP family protein n=1 Tax=unclassified Rhodopseudomonas TaxID=2638247 RepID=UPI002234D9BD|nr:NIPSNAP family protein [Rhodopseudomonas sp. P2A-2r]UZE51057.1 NIPSNAP family protein [Rhodopseudomonas sp. P2A-2r]
MPYDSPIVDLRTYTIQLRKMAEFIDVFDRLAMPVQLKYVGQPLGMYSSAVGPLNQVVHLWGFLDMGEFERRHAERDKDPDWPAYLRASGHLITAQENRLIRKIDLPSLRRA